MNTTFKNLKALKHKQDTLYKKFDISKKHPASKVEFKKVVNELKALDNDIIDYKKIISIKNSIKLLIAVSWVVIALFSWVVVLDLWPF